MPPGTYTGNHTAHITSESGKYDVQIDSSQNQQGGRVGRHQMLCTRDQFGSQLGVDFTHLLKNRYLTTGIYHELYFHVICPSREEPGSCRSDRPNHNRVCFRGILSSVSIPQAVFPTWGLVEERKSPIASESVFCAPLPDSSFNAASSITSVCLNGLGRVTSVIVPGTGSNFPRPLGGSSSLSSNGACTSATAKNWVPAMTGLLAP